MMEFDPRDLISPPFKACPKCNAEQFGVLMINGDRYIRRCRSCFFPDPHKGERHSIPLPSIRKKVIYLDQFAISNMVLALDPESEQRKQGKFDPGTDGERWITLYKKLYRLYRLQLIVCPYSMFHVEESMVAPHMEKKLKRLYELLSHNTGFIAPQRIQDKQMHYFAGQWIKGEQPDFSTLMADSVTRDPIHVWNEKILVSVPNRWTQEDIEEQRVSRKLGYEGLGEIADRWRSDSQEKRFQEYFLEESASYGKAVLKSYVNYLLRRYAEVIFPNYAAKIVESQNLEYIEENHPHVQLVNEMHRAFLEAGYKNDSKEIPDSLVSMFQRLGLSQEQINADNIHRLLQEAGLPNTSAMQRVAELLLSDDFREKVPYIRIQALLWASLAIRMRQSKDNPNQGTFNDVELISTLLPYCDAMMIDREWCNVLRFNPVKEKIGYDTRIFAPMYMNEFLSYLDTIEASATREHLDLVNEVYGKIKPYTSIFGLKDE